MTAPDDYEELLRALKRKLFGDGSTNVPRVLIELLDHLGAGRCPAALFECDYQKATFGIYWLQGALLHRLQYSGWEENAKATHEVFPLARLVGITSDFTFDWDDFNNRHKSWDRKVTLTFESEQPVVLDAGGKGHGAAAKSDLIDAVLKAFSAD